MTDRHILRQTHIVILEQVQCTYFAYIRDCGSATFKYNGLDTLQGVVEKDSFLNRSSVVSIHEWQTALMPQSNGKCCVSTS